ncbi:hypothetical protein [Micrococcus luteus]
MAASTSGTTCPVTVRYTTLWGTTTREEAEQLARTKFTTPEWTARVP